MPPFDRNEDEERDEFMLAFEAFDKGELTAANAHEFELPEPPAKKADEGGASGADPAERGGQHTGRADSTAAAEGKDNTRDGQRDQRGRFTKGEASEQPAAAGQQPQATPDAGKPAAPQQATGQQAAVPAPEPAPDGLSAKAAAAWATATPEAREYIRETESVLAQVSADLNPVITEAKAHQLPWKEYANRLVKADRFLRTTPADAMLWLAETHGVDLDELADLAAAKRAGLTPPSQTQQPSPDINRVVQPLAAQVQEIRSQLAQRQEREEAEAARQANERRAAAKREWETFASKAEHWKDVEAAVITAVPILRAQRPSASASEILQAAYETATWANPAVREKLIAAQQRKAQDAGRNSRSRDLESVTGHFGAPSGSTRKAANGSADPLRDEIAEHWATFDSR